MELIDYIVLAVYLIGTLGLGVFFYFRNKSADDMFSAGGDSPWWVSGLSSFMTIFSAATFVVWGGIAYKFGVVALSINMCYGIASLAVGFLVASRWKQTGATSPAEFIALRFGEKTVHIYIWIMLVFRIIGSAVALYGLCVLLCALMPLPVGHFLQDPTTGHLSIPYAIMIFGVIIAVYTMIGGLWAVLMTDVIQFLILTLSVLFVVPLMLVEVGGFQAFTQNAPDKFFNLVAGEFTWYFLAGWLLMNFFAIGSDWAFAQRFLSVRKPTDAKKSAFLFGALYIVSPFVWLAPPLMYRVINPDANPEQAYILASQLVLPAGMLGMMVAAMFSATASSVSSQLNVFAGALTTSIYQGQIKKDASEKETLWAGRFFTIILGTGLVWTAIYIPNIGGAAGVVISKSSLIVGPMLAPVLFGLFYRGNSVTTLVGVGIASAITAFIFKYALQSSGFLSNVEALAHLSYWAQNNGRLVDMLIGLVAPTTVLTLFHFFGTQHSAGWDRIAQRAANQKAQEQFDDPPVDHTPAWIVSIAMAMIGTLMLIIAVFSSAEAFALCIFSLMTFAISASIVFVIKKSENKNPGNQSTT